VLAPAVTSTISALPSLPLPSEVNLNDIPADQLKNQLKNPQVISQRNWIKNAAKPACAHSRFTKNVCK
jgi:hypothetical protein